jgi:hypothetical protein
MYVIINNSYGDNIQYGRVLVDADVRIMAYRKIMWRGVAKDDKDRHIINHKQMFSVIRLIHRA